MTYRFTSSNDDWKKNDNELSRREMLKMMWPLALIITGSFNACNLLDQSNQKDVSAKRKNRSGKSEKVKVKPAEFNPANIKSINYTSERAIGESLAIEGFKYYGIPVQNDEIQKYVNLVGNSIAINSSRPKIPYHFVVVESPIFFSFACPGGIIVISSSLFKLMNSESELAGILAHEIAHVCHKHTLQYVSEADIFSGENPLKADTMKDEAGKKFKKIISNLKNVVFNTGLDRNMEFEADISGMLFAYRTGYNPEGIIHVLELLKEKEKRAQNKGSWFMTHPPLSERIIMCRNVMPKYPDASSLADVKGRFGKYKKLF